MHTAKLTVKRTDQYANKVRKIHLYLDGKKVYDIANGETKTFEIPAGTHHIYAKIDWCKTPAFTLNLAAGQEKTLELGSPVLAKKSSFAAPLIRLIILFGAIFLSNQYQNDLILWLALGLLIAWFAVETFFTKEKSVLYYLTVGRSKYLYLKEL